MLEMVREEIAELTLQVDSQVDRCRHQVCETRKEGDPAQGPKLRPCFLSRSHPMQMSGHAPAAEQVLLLPAGSLDERKIFTLISCRAASRICWFVVTLLTLFAGAAAAGGPAG